MSSPASRSGMGTVVPKCATTRCAVCERHPALFVRRFRGLGFTPACVACLLWGWARGHLIITSASDCQPEDTTQPAKVAA